MESEIPSELLVSIFEFVRGHPRSGALHAARLACRRWCAVIDEHVDVAPAREPHVSAFRLGYLSPPGLMSEGRPAYDQQLLVTMACGRDAQLYDWFRALWSDELLSAGNETMVRGLALWCGQLDEFSDKELKEDYRGCIHPLDMATVQKDRGVVLDASDLARLIEYGDVALLGNLLNIGAAEAVRAWEQPGGGWICLPEGARRFQFQGIPNTTMVSHALAQGWVDVSNNGSKWFQRAWLAHDYLGCQLVIDKTLTDEFGLRLLNGVLNGGIIGDGLTFDWVQMICQGRTENFLNAHENHFSMDVSHALTVRCLHYTIEEMDILYKHYGLCRLVPPLVKHIRSFIDMAAHSVDDLNRVEWLIGLLRKHANHYDVTVLLEEAFIHPNSNQFIVDWLNQVQEFTIVDRYR